MAVSTDFLQTWSGTYWWTGLLLNTKYQTHNLVSAPQGTQTNPSLFCTPSRYCKKEKNEGVHCFSGPPCCLRQYFKRETWRHLQKIKTTIFERYHPNHVHRMPLPSYWWRQNFQGGCAQQRLKKGCPLSPLLYSLYTNEIDRFLTVQRGAATALILVQVPHCNYADDIALTSNTAECLQFQLNKFHNYTRFKGLKLNTDDKTKIMVFFSKGPSAIPIFTYDGTRLELVNHFKYLGFISHSWW